MIRPRYWPLLALLAALGCVAVGRPRPGSSPPSDLLLYAPFDGAPDAWVARGGMENLDRGEHFTFVPGRQGQALVADGDCRFAAQGNFNPRAGTVAMWVRPHWDGASEKGHYLFSLYGGRALPRPWAVNRWGLYCASGRLEFALYTKIENRVLRVTAPISDWKAEQWHHVAATWSGTNSGRARGELRLFLDGKPAGNPVANARMDVGEIGDALDIGRDSDGSPDYAEADVDELYIYSRPLHPQEVAAGANAPPPPVVTPVLAKAAARQQRADWWDSAWPVRREVALLPSEQSRPKAFIRVRPDVQPQLAALGVVEPVDIESFRAVEGEGADATPIPCRMEDGFLMWPVAGPIPAGQERRFEVYCQTRRCEFIAPLRTLSVGTEKGTGTFSRNGPLGADQKMYLSPFPPDYAADVLGDAWDFNNEGDFEGIDQWGDKPEYLRNRKVAGGVLSMDVSEDPFFIWGDMWGQAPKAGHRIAIDLSAYPVLRMRVRQSVPSAEWELYGRKGESASLLHYAFTVSGTSWQTVTVDLVREARWSGVLSAFRIDPTCHVNARVEMDWIRLERVDPVEAGPVECLGRPSSAPFEVTLSTDYRWTTVGAPQNVTAHVYDIRRRPVSNQPVTVRAQGGPGLAVGRSEGQPSLALSPTARRGFTDAKGRLAVSLVPSYRPGVDTVTAAADFSLVDPATLALEAAADSPHGYVVAPATPSPLQAGSQPATLCAQIADRFGNPLPVAGRKVAWTVSESGRVAAAAPFTDNGGKVEAEFFADSTERYVYRVSVSDGRGLRGESAPIVVLPSRQPRRIRLLPNGYFQQPDGTPFIPLGGFYINWIGLPDDKGEEGRKVVSFTDASDEQITHWLAFLNRCGVNCLRFMLRTHRKNGMEPMDVVGRVNPELFAAAMHLFDLARPFKMRFLLVVHEDYTKPAYFNAKALETFCKPRYEGEDLDLLPPYQRRFIRDGRLIGDIGEKYTDPDVIACQDQYARQLVGDLRNAPEVFGYELENEMVSCPPAWANHAIETIRKVDPNAPVCVSHGGGGLATADPLFWTLKTTIGFYTYHLYPPPSSRLDLDYGAAVDLLARYGRMCGPCFLGESSGDEFSVYPTDADRPWLMRDIIWMSLLDGNPGCFFWNARGLEVEQFKDVSRIMGMVDWTAWKRGRPEIGVVVSHPLDDDKYYRTEAGKKDYAMMARYVQHFLSSATDFDFVLDRKGYPLTADLSAFSPPTPSERRFTLSPGFQLKCLAREGMAEALLYVRNFAGVREWAEKKFRCYLRERKPADLSIGFHLPPGKYTALTTDLDTHQTTETPLDAGKLQLGVTDHDFVILLRRL